MSDGLQANALMLAAVSYAGHLRWSVVPGASIDESGVCSCGNALCGEPGAHPDKDTAGLSPSRDAQTLCTWWERFPGASVLAPVGDSFDAVSVPDVVGREAIARTFRDGAPNRTALAGNGRIVFLLSPGLAAVIRIRLGRHIHTYAIRLHERDELIALPPSNGVKWVTDDRPFTSISVAPSRILAALASASARHAARQRSARCQARPSAAFPPTKASPDRRDRRWCLDA